MTKLSLVRLYRTEDVPDHILQEVIELVNKMGSALGPILKDQHSNIILSAFNRFHAGMIVTLVSENGLKDAAQTEAIGIIKNVEHISGLELFKESNE